MRNPNGEDSADVLSAAMADLVANFATPSDAASVLASVTARAVELIHEVDFADILLIDGDRYQSLAPTSPIANDLDTLQWTLQEGPCLAAAVGDGAVVCPDFSTETRWPRFAAAAVEAGIGSMMSFQLYTSPAAAGGVGGRGALNLLSRNRLHFSVEDQIIGAMLASHAATALIAADRQTQFESALASRDLIGQAKGILMERFKVDAVRAFALMTKLSQDSNTPVRIIAARIVESTDTPETE